MSRAGRKIGFGIVGIGLLLTAAGVLVAGGASAHAFSCNDASHPDFGMIDGPAQYWDIARIDASEINPAAVTSPAGQTIPKGPLVVTLKNATSSDGQPVGNGNLGTIDFSTNEPVDATFVMSPHSQWTWKNGITVFPTEVTEGTLDAKEGSIEFVEFCYDLEPSTGPTTTKVEVAPTSEVAPTTAPTVAPTAAPTSAAVAPAAEVAGITEVLPQQVAAQPQLAFTGSNNTTPLVVGGTALMMLGLALVGVDHLGVVRRGRHSR